MAQVIRFEISGEPVAQGRPVFNTNAGRAFDPIKSRNWKHKVAYYAQKCMQEQGLKMFKKDEALEFHLTVVRSIPASFSKKKRQQIEEFNLYPTTKPDLSNYLKGVEDSLNGICYEDDSAICYEILQKVYGDEPKVIITVEKLGEPF